jgi:hypothetical protein
MGRLPDSVGNGRSRHIGSRSDELSLVYLKQSEKAPYTEPLNENALTDVEG